MTHADLVKRAGAWLRGTIGCKVVLLEHTSLGEHPDAIGWRGVCRSWVVECKVSRSDFHADQKKYSRRLGRDHRPGFQCYYLVPAGLLQPDDVPDWWGLLWAEARRIRVMKLALPSSARAGEPRQRWSNPLYDGLPGDDRNQRARDQEFQRLYQELRRYQAQGIRYKSGVELTGVTCVCGRRRYPHERPCKRCGGTEHLADSPQRVTGVPPVDESSLPLELSSGTDALRLSGRNPHTGGRS
jgi:hypothetical protein